MYMYKGVSWFISENITRGDKTEHRESLGGD